MPARTLTLKGVDWWVPHRLEKGMRPNKDTKPQRGWIMRSHIGWGGNRNILYKGVKTSSSETPFKTLRGIPKKKA